MCLQFGDNSGYSFGLGKRKVMSKTGLRALTCLSFHQPHVCRLRTFKGLNKLANLHEILIRQLNFHSHLGRQLGQSQKQPTLQYMQEVHRTWHSQHDLREKENLYREPNRRLTSTREPTQSFATLNQLSSSLRPQNHPESQSLQSCVPKLFVQDLANTVLAPVFIKNTASIPLPAYLNTPAYLDTHYTARLRDVRILMPYATVLIL